MKIYLKVGIDKKAVIRGSIENNNETNTKKQPKTESKPYKIKLNDGDKRAQGMYILLDANEEKYTAKGVISPPDRIYTIQIAIEVMRKNERCRGKRNFNIAKGTSIVKAVESMIPKKNDMIKTLKEKGSLKIEKVNSISKIKKDSSINELFDNFIGKKEINKKPNTIRVYKTNYNTHIKPYIGSMVLDEIKEDTIQEKVINIAINKGKEANTIIGLKRILKPLFENNNKLINWKLIELPKAKQGKRIYNKSIEDTKRIVEALINYPHKKVNGVFKFLLTGRRLHETLYLEHEMIDYNTNTFTIPAKLAKANDDFTFNLTPTLNHAIKSQDTNIGRIFRIESRQMLEHFKKAMREINIYDMVLHDIRSMVAQTALDSGADIYEVSKMLAHKRVSTTEQSYAKGGASQAMKAQEKFEQTLQLQKTSEIIDVEVIDNKYMEIKKLFPDVNDETIKYVISILEGKVLMNN